MFRTSFFERFGTRRDMPRAWFVRFTKHMATEAAHRQELHARVERIHAGAEAAAGRLDAMTTWLQQESSRRREAGRENASTGWFLRRFT